MEKQVHITITPQPPYLVFGVRGGGIFLTDHLYIGNMNVDMMNHL